jgi:hypothetical protein
MDCCMVRNLSTPIKGAYTPRVTSQSGKLFAAYAARWRKQAVEQVMDDGNVHGVFTYTLLQGLKGEAADPESGQITSERLKNYLIHAMPRVMSAQNRENPNISHEPDFGPVDDMVFGSVPELPKHAVTLSLPASALGKMLTVDGGPLAKPLSQAIAATNETLQLPNGIYIAEVDNLGSVGFKVIGGQVHVQIAG